jgi:type II secretory pathway pseudopilin PulG
MNQSRQNGQTLIETLVAVFIMVMGITAALGLANYSLNASTNIRKQIIAMGLAREGMEAVKNMRDTNWLVGQLNNDCYSFQNNPNCYRDWLNPTGGFNIQAINPNRPDFDVSFDASTSRFWTITNLNAGSNNNYRLNHFPAAGANGFYSSVGGGNLSDYYRQVIIDNTTTTAPFDRDIGPRLLVRSRVWWVDKKCPATNNWPGTGACGVELQMYLTNWKTF